MFYFIGDVLCANIVGMLVFLFFKSKDDMGVLFSVGNLAKNDNLDVNLKCAKSQALSSSKKSPNCHSKEEQKEHLSTDAVGSIQDTTER